MTQYRVFFTPSADKALQRLPAAVQTRIASAAKELGNDPRPHGCVKLKGEDDLWRIRVGDYRVIYAIEDEELVVLVVRVAHRKDVYR